jgi:hypothetical protein
MQFSSQPLSLVVVTLSLIIGANDAVSAGILEKSWNRDFTSPIIVKPGNHSLQAQFPQLPPSGDRPRAPFSSNDRDDFEDCLDEDDRDDFEDCLEDLRDDRFDDDHDDFEDDLEDCRDEDDHDDRQDCLEDLREDRFDDDRDGFRPDFSPGARSPMWRR